MNENTCSNQSSILDQLRAIPEGKQVRFTLRRPDGSEFTHISAIAHRAPRYPDGFDMFDKEVALATPFPAPCGPWINPYWARWSNPDPTRCDIVAIEQLAPSLPDLETLRKWVADGTQVRIEYNPPGATQGEIGPSPVTCKLSEAFSYRSGYPVVRVQGVHGQWNMRLAADDGFKGSDYLPIVTSITPVVEKVQTAEEIDTIMQRAAKSGAQVEAITATGDTHVGDVFDPKDGWYRVPATEDSEHYYWWLSAKTDDYEPHRTIVSVRELTPKQTEAEMLALLQQAEREGNHVEASMADGSKLAGAISAISMGGMYRAKMLRCQIGGNFASFGAMFFSERIAAVKLLPREEKHPTIQVKIDASASDHVVTFHTADGALTSGFAGAFSLGYSATMQEETHITPTCCADVAPYIGRRVRVTWRGNYGQEGILTCVGIDADGDPAFWLDHELDPDCWGMGDGITIELLPDEPLTNNLMIEPTCPADLEPYLGRRVRVLAGPERELVREGTLTDSDVTGNGALRVDTGPAWSYGSYSSRSTLVEVLPELPAADDDDTSIEDESDAVSADYYPGEPVLSFGTVQMQVNGEPVLVTIGSDGTLTTRDGRRLCLTTEGDAITAPCIMSKLTLAELLAMAPPPSEVRAYEAFQDTVRTAITTGLITA
jgi:hypothetical protein